jgi:hypothetical protein
MLTVKSRYQANFVSNFNSMKKQRIFFSLLVVSLITLPIVLAAGKPVTPPTATLTLSGSIVDSETREHLGGVFLYFEEIGKGIYTDPEGNFTLEGIQPGSYQVSLKFISYSDKKMTLKVRKANKNFQVIKMEPVQP